MEFAGCGQDLIGCFLLVCESNPDTRLENVHHLNAPSALWPVGGRSGQNSASKGLGPSALLEKQVCKLQTSSRVFQPGEDAAAPDSSTRFAATGYFTGMTGSPARWK